MKLKKGDKVIVIAGKDKGKIGEILKAFPKESKVLVAGVNEVKKHQKPSRANKGGVVAKLMPIHYSNIAYYDESLKKGSRVGFKIDENSEKKRYSKKSSEIIG